MAQAFRQKAAVKPDCATCEEYEVLKADKQHSPVSPLGLIDRKLGILDRDWNRQRLKLLREKLTLLNMERPGTTVEVDLQTRMAILQSRFALKEVDEGAFEAERIQLVNDYDHFLSDLATRGEVTSAEKQSRLLAFTTLK